MSKPRKWSNVSLPEAPEPEVTEREKEIRVLMDERADKTMRELAEEYKDAVEEEEFELLAAKKRSKLYEALERLISRQLERIQEETGHDSWKGMDIGTFSPSTSIIPIVTNKSALYRHIEDEGMKSILTLEFNKLRELVGNVLEEFTKMSPAERATCPMTLEQPLPGVKVWKKKSVRFTAARKPKP